MTQPEQEAREMLADEYERMGHQYAADQLRISTNELDAAIIRTMLAFAARPTAGIDREVARMREIANDWRRPALAQVEGPNDLKIYGGTIADDIDRWADMLEAAAKTGERGAWRPISTAPKDGSGVLVTNDRGMFAAEFDADWGDGGWWMVSDGKDFERPLRGDTPTYWQPLPDAPIVGGEG